MTDELNTLRKKVASLEDELYRMKGARNDALERLKHEEKIRADAVEALLNEESFFEAVVRWHLKVSHPVGKEAHPLTNGYDDSLALGMRLVREEFKELQDAWEQHATVDAADAIGDLIWVLCGLAARLGYDLDEVWYEIKKANYAKAGGPRREDGKLLKPEGWEPPDVAGALRRGRDLTKI